MTLKIHSRSIFAEISPQSVVYHASLREKTTFRIGETVGAFFAPFSREDLITVYRRCLEENLPIYLLGGGSNLLITQPLSGVVFSLKNLKQITRQGSFLQVGCGISLIGLIQYAEKAGLGGLEKLIGIPGTLGGALSNNAGGRYSSISDVVWKVHTLEADGSLRWRTLEECGFAYRHSELKTSLLLEAILQLKPDSSPEALKLAKIEVLSEKKRTQPLSAYSAGCIFKNPRGFSAGRLIENAGLKGKTSGDAMVSPHHANFIVNRGQASARDVLSLIEHIQFKVAQREGIELQPEIRFWR